MRIMEKKRLLYEIILIIHEGKYYLLVFTTNLLSSNKFHWVFNVELSGSPFSIIENFPSGSFSSAWPSGRILFMSYRYK